MIFFTYVNEGWISSTEIPPGHWDYGQTDILGLRVDQQIRSLIASAKPAFCLTCS
jgi:hypothetical protein